MSPSSPRIRNLVLLGALALLGASPAAHAAEAPPPAPLHDVVDTVWGVPVHDPYRYMENFEDPEFKAFMRAQADSAAATLARVPGRDELYQRLREFDAGRPFRLYDVHRMPDGRLFYQKIEAQENVSKLYVRPAGGGDERILLDPEDVASKDGGHVSIDFYAPSPDGKHIAYGLAASGSEQTTLYVLEVASAFTLPEVIDRLENAYTEPQWTKDGSGFFYQRRRDLAPGTPETEIYKQTKTFFHRLGTKVADDPLVLGYQSDPNVALSDEDFPSIVLSEASPWAIVKIKHGDSNPLTLYGARIAADGAIQKPWTKLCDVPDSVVDFAATGDHIDLMTAHGAPRFQVVRMALATPDFARAQVIVPPSADVVDGIASAKDALYVQLMRGGAGRVVRLEHTPGAKIEPLATPEGAPSGRFSAVAPDVPGMLLTTTSWTRGGKIWAYDPHTRSFSDTKLAPVGKYDAMPGFTSEEVEVASWDGTKVPLSIVYKQGIKLDGSNPTLLVGYGSYGISQDVNFSATRLAWLEKGGVWAMAHVRGGGENGAEWHRAGQMTTKPNTWKDFIACAEYLVKQGYTRPSKLAGQGGSAGGITIGRAVTERPDLFRAAIMDVGALDMVRGENTTNGVPNIQEFGTVKNHEQFKALLEMSAYHHVKDGTQYPAVLLTHGMNDPRVDPWNTGKMGARLQAATASDRPILLRLDYGSGHGIGSTKTQSLSAFADKYSFLLWQMETPGFLP